MSREFLIRLVLGAFGIATVTWYWRIPGYLDEFVGMALVAAPFVVLIAFYRQLWTALLAGFALLGLLWYSVYFIRTDGHSTASLIFLLTLPLSYVVATLGFVAERLVRRKHENRNTVGSSHN